MISRARPALLLFAIAMSVSPARVASAQAIDCFKAINAVEKTICTDSNLSALDVKMASLYRDAIKHATPEQQKAIAGQHQRWVTSTRDACGKQKDVRACVTEAYEARNAQLTSYASGEAKLPTAPITSAGSRTSSTRASTSSTSAPSSSAPTSPTSSSKKSASSAAKTGTHVYTCSDQSTLKVTYTRKGRARVQYDTSDWTLPHVKSSSGARYRSGTTSVWNKGHELTFDHDGKKLTCRE